MVIEESIPRENVGREDEFSEGWVLEPKLIVILRRCPPKKIDMLTWGQRLSTASTELRNRKATTKTAQETNYQQLERD